MFSDRTAIEFGGLMGIPVRVNLSLLLLAALLVHFNGSGAEFAAELVAFTLLTASLYIHALGQALGARAAGLTVTRITLFGGGGRIDHDGREADETARMVILGPLANLSVWAVATLLLPFTSGHLAWGLQALAFINLFIGLVSLLPVRPLPGGKLFAMALGGLSPVFAARIAGVVGLVTGVALLAGMALSFMLFGLVLFIIPAFAAHWQMLNARGAGRVASA